MSLWETLRRSSRERAPLRGVTKPLPRPLHDGHGGIGVLVDGTDGTAIDQTEAGILAT